MNTTNRTLLIEWVSNQQMDWEMDFIARNFHFVGVLNHALDTGGTSEWVITNKGERLKITSATSWDTGSALVEISGLAETTSSPVMNIIVNDPYVGDRRFEQKWQDNGTVCISSKEWPLKNCFIRVSSDPDEIQHAEKILRVLSQDRRKNIEELLKLASETKDSDQRQALRMRAAAACTGGCNHGPVGPDGWDLAINIYQDVIDEAPAEDDLSINAAWAQASCYSCWSPQSGCDAGGRGKGDWQKAFEAYEKLYQQSALPGDKVDALRRKAEVECFEAYEWWPGLGTYRRIVEEYPGTVPLSPHWTYRTCAPHCGTENIAWDIYRALVYNSKSEQEVQDVFNNIFGEISNNPHVQTVAKYIGKTQ